MYLQAYPITVKVGTQWRQIDAVIYDGQPQHRFSFLYIGGDGITENFSTEFRSGISTEDYLQAQILIEKSNRSSLPDVIFIDLPLNKYHLNAFYAFLRDKGIWSETVVIYNESKLTSANIEFLKESELVDDVFRLDRPGIRYSSKISFLKKVKFNQERFEMNREKVYADKRLGFDFLFFKRLLDMAGAAVAMIVLSPVFLLISLVIWLESKGPVIYTSRRAGRGFKVFRFYKFRTMEMGADLRVNELRHLNQYDLKENGAKFLKIVDDPRVTRIGKFLRKTSLDELPQFFNVLKGDMSLVGNRPLPIYEASTLTTNEFVERFMAPAGITGLWQIKKRGKEEMSVEERINLDIFYARKANLFYDLWIMAQTPTALFQKSNV